MGNNNNSFTTKSLFVKEQAKEAELKPVHNLFFAIAKCDAVELETALATTPTADRLSLLDDCDDKKFTPLMKSAEIGFLAGEDFVQQIADNNFHVTLKVSIFC